MEAPGTAGPTRPDDPFKKYNEMLKAFESLTKREGELLQKLAQSDNVSGKQRLEWAEELKSVISAANTINEKRATIVEQMAAKI